VAGLDVRAGVVRDQARQLEQTQAAQVPGTVQRVEPGGGQGCGVADVVQVARGDQQVPVLRADPRRDPFGVRKWVTRRGAAVGVRFFDGAGSVVGRLVC
jgi:hypothetical protein